MNLYSASRPHTPLTNLHQFDVHSVVDGLGKKGSFKSSKIDSHGDHRIAMASSIGSLRSDGETTILDCLNVNTSFPNFIDTCKEVGIDIKRYE